MALLTTYSGLLTSIIRYAMRTGDAEFEAQAPGFVELAEHRISRELRTASMERYAVGMTDDDGYADLPSDYLEFRAISPGAIGAPALRLQSPMAAMEAFPGGGIATAYSFIGNQIRVYPAGAGEIRMTYYAKPTPLSEANPTNWLLEHAPDIYLYASLLEAAPFMEEDARAQMWITYYDRAVANFKASDVGGRFANGNARVRSQTP